MILLEIFELRGIFLQVFEYVFFEMMKLGIVTETSPSEIVEKIHYRKIILIYRKNKILLRSNFFINILIIYIAALMKETGIAKYFLPYGKCRFSCNFSS